jgi:probable DNA metabolism protein
MYNIYVYDDSFEGLMTAVYEAYYSDIKPDKIITFSEYQPQLADNKKVLATDFEKSDKVITAIKNKISCAALQRIFYVYLSSIPDADTLLYNYIKLGFKLGNKVDLHLHNDIVLNTHKIERKVTSETHYMLGFIRFQEIQPNLYYSPIEPDHNIISLLAPHFSGRLSSENWIIHDVKRELAVVYNLKEWIVTSLKKDQLPKENYTSDNFYELLWKEYFNTVAIKDRINPKLQSRMMPKRYWKHLTELK